MTDYSKYQAVDRRNEIIRENQYFVVIDLEKKAKVGEKYMHKVYSREYMDILIERGDLDDPKYVVYVGTSTYG